MDADSMQMMAEQPESSDDDYGEIGISIEPLTMLELLVSSKTADKAESYQVSKNQQYLAVAIERLAENMFNYLSSFAKPASGYLELSEPVVPVKTLQDWYNNVTRRLSRDPTWLSSMSK